MKVLITSGGTKIPIDDVRFIHNMSTGRFASEVAEAFLYQDDEVSFLHAKDSHTPFTFNMDLFSDSEAWDAHEILSSEMRKVESYGHNYRQRVYKTYDEYVTRLQTEIITFKPDVIVLAAAVSDYGVPFQSGKISSSTNLSLPLVPLEKVIDKVRKWAPDSYIVGFKLLVGSTPSELRIAAEAQLKRADVDMVVGNDLTQLRTGNHRLTLFYGENDQWRIPENQAVELAEFITSVQK